MSEERGAGQQPDELDELDEDLGLLDEELPPDDEPPIDGEPPSDEPPPSDAKTPEPRRGPRTPEERRVHALRARAREAEAENRRLRTLQEQLLTQTRQPAPPQADPYRQAEADRLEAERVAMMAPHEVAAYYANRAEQRVQQQLYRAQIEAGDRIDKLTFRQIMATEPAAKRLETQVEQELANHRQQGMNPTREAIYDLLIGREVRQRAQRQTATQRTAGARRIASQQTAPGGTARSSVPAERGRRRSDDSDEALDARLRSVTVGDAWNSNW